MDTTTLLIYILAITAFVLNIMSMPMQIKIMHSRPKTGPEATNLPVAFFLFNIFQALAILSIALYVTFNDQVLIILSLAFLNATGIISVLTYIGYKFKLRQ